MAKGKGNNTSNRNRETSYRTVRGKTVVPVLYAGRSLGHGQYIAGTIDGVLVCNSLGIPIPYKQINELVV